MSGKQKAVFFDRDGVINKERNDYVKNVKELEIYSQAVNAIKLLKEAGYLIVVVTNQSAINRGLMNRVDLFEIHNEIQRKLQERGTAIDAFYFCPHRPDENCSCRKPKSGLLENAITELNIEPTSSWLIGNKNSDVQAALSVNCKAIKIDSNQSLSDAVQTILRSN